MLSDVFKKLGNSLALPSRDNYAVFVPVYNSYTAARYEFLDGFIANFDLPLSKNAFYLFPGLKLFLT